MANCAICTRQQSSDDKIIFETPLWVARHSVETDILGYVLLESKRHFLDFSEATTAECESFGTVASMLVQAIRNVTSAERVYSISLAEVVPHFHLHLIPRTVQMPAAHRGRNILAYPLEPAAPPDLMQDVCEKLRAQLKQITLAKIRQQQHEQPHPVVGPVSAPVSAVL